MAFWIFTLSLMTAPLSHARADEPAKDRLAPASANAVTEADKPAATDNASDEGKNSSKSSAAASTDAGIKTRVDKFKNKNASNPYTDKVAISAEDLAKTLNDDQAQAFAQIRDGASILRTVRITADEVGAAVASCGKNNPDLKKGMDDRFAGWKKDVDAALDKNDKSMQDGINASIAGDPKKVRNYLKLLDQWSAYNEAKIEKRPATTESACKTLQASMDKSGPAIVTQLESLKWPMVSKKADASPAKKSDDENGAKQGKTEPAAGEKP